MDCKNSPLEEQYIATPMCRRSSAADRLLWQLLVMMDMDSPCECSLALWKLPLPGLAHFWGISALTYHPSALAQVWDCHHSYCQGDLHRVKDDYMCLGQWSVGTKGVFSLILWVRDKGWRRSRDVLLVKLYYKLYLPFLLATGFWCLWRWDSLNKTFNITSYKILLE